MASAGRQYSAEDVLLTLSGADGCLGWIEIPSVAMVRQQGAAGVGVDAAGGAAHAPSGHPLLATFDSHLQGGGSPGGGVMGAGGAAVAVAPGGPMSPLTTPPTVAAPAPPATPPPLDPVAPADDPHPDVDPELSAISDAAGVGRGSSGSRRRERPLPPGSPEEPLKDCAPLDYAAQSAILVGSAGPRAGPGAAPRVMREFEEDDAEADEGAGGGTDPRPPPPPGGGPVSAHAANSSSKAPPYASGRHPRSLDDADAGASDGGGGLKIKKKGLQFGIKPDVFISAEDFGVEPELLTTAQKVAILESQAFQNKNFNPILPPAAKTKALVVAPSSAGSQVNLRALAAAAAASSGTKDQSYVPSGLRMNTETLDAEHTDVLNDGGPVAKTTDRLVDKISKWEGWVKDIGNSNSPKR